MSTTLSDLQQEFEKTKPSSTEPISVISATTSHTENIADLAAALCKAQGEIEAADKDSENPHFKSRYADLASIISAVRGPLSRNGLCFTQSPSTAGSLVTVETTIWHQTGQYLKGYLTICCNDSRPQSIGSGISYAKRYALQSMLGVASEDDDDGNAAQGKPAQPTRVAFTGGDNPNTKLPGHAHHVESMIRQMGVKTREGVDVMVKMLSGGKYPTIKDAAKAGAGAMIEIEGVLNKERQISTDEQLIALAKKEAGL